jgi:prepilin-type N-terminal cleavage/methylation domain-containing protein
MKNNQTERVESPESRVESQPALAPLFPRPRPSTLAPRHAFTLIELLVVMAIIGALAAMLLAVVGGVKKKQYVYNTQAEMAQLETAIERYKAAYGFYPPDNRDQTQTAAQRFRVNQLYYELEGTTNDGTAYRTLDGSSIIPNADVTTAFGVGGFMNSTKPGAGEDSTRAKNFLPDLRPKQIWPYPGYTNNGSTVGVNLLIGSVGGPDATHMPLGKPDLNPWRYNSSNPTNNPGSYDLYILLAIGRNTNLICNWSKQVRILTDNSLP